MASKSADLGKWAEKRVHDWLTARSLSDASFAFHRYPDARAAQGALAAQPADFLVAHSTKKGWRGLGFHIEVKETAQTDRLPKNKIRQYGLLKKFDWGGFSTHVVIYRSKLSDWVMLDRADLFDHDEAPASFSLKGKKSYPTAAAALREIFP